MNKNTALLIVFVIFTLLMLIGKKYFGITS